MFIERYYWQLMTKTKRPFDKNFLYRSVINEFKETHQTLEKL